MLVFDLKSKTINGFSFSNGVHDDTTAGQISPILQQSKHEKKQLTRLQTLPSTVTSQVTRRKSLHQDAANRSKIQDFSCCSCLDLNTPGASVSLLIKWEWCYFLTCLSLACCQAFLINTVRCLLRLWDENASVKYVNSAKKNLATQSGLVSLFGLQN